MARPAGPHSSLAPAIRTADGRVRGFKGTAGAARGVRRVDVAIARMVDDKCSWYLGHGRFQAAGSCVRPVWLHARGGKRWTAALKLGQAGAYRVRSRAVEKRGAREASATPDNTRIITVG
jgi:hypothetical protein